MDTTGLIKWIRERQAIYERRMAGQPKPWTKDSIMLDYKFTNVMREHDTVTQWVAENWRTPHHDDDDLWFAMVVARLLNRPTTLEKLGYPVPWSAARFVKLVHTLKAAHEPAFSGAYMISTNSYKADKAEFLAERVLTPLWKNRVYVRPRVDDTLAKFHARLTQHFGMGSFLSAQVVADVKYVEPLDRAEDWENWAASGPGSRRGLNRIYGRPINRSWGTEANWYSHFYPVLLEVRQAPGLPELHAQDVQNCLCEFDKYERIRLGEGRTRSRYNGRG